MFFTPKVRFFLERLSDSEEVWFEIGVLYHKSAIEGLCLDSVCPGEDLDGKLKYLTIMWIIITNPSSAYELVKAILLTPGED